MRHAIGLAASRCGSVLANAGTMTKSTHCGLAGSLGLDAALLARRGFTANIDVVETPRGYAQAFFGPNADMTALDHFWAALATGSSPATRSRCSRASTARISASRRRSRRVAASPIRP
ncbi:MAG: MmgE/PrpD family protein [Pseudomonadota bacterium]